MSLPASSCCRFPPRCTWWPPWCSRSGAAPLPAALQAQRSWRRSARLVPRPARRARRPSRCAGSLARCGWSPWTRAPTPTRTCPAGSSSGRRPFRWTACRGAARIESPACKKYIIQNLCRNLLSFMRSGHKLEANLQFNVHLKWRYTK